MIASTTCRLLQNGRPCRPTFDGNNGSIRPHCSSVNTRYLEPVDLTQPASREPPDPYGRHALVRASYDDPDPHVTLIVATEELSCDYCHLALSDADLLERAGVEMSFETEGSLEDVADLFEEEYNNE